MSNSAPAMLVDYEYCLGCLDCEVACMTERGVGPDKMGIKVMKLGALKTARGNTISCRFPPIGATRAPGV